MKKVLLILTLVFTANVNAQTEYENGMNKAFELWETQKNSEASQLFERIANTEKDNWLPPYYAAMTLILEGFSIKDEATLTTKLNKAQQFLDDATAISENNAEIIIVQALLNTVYVAFDGQKYGMTLSGKNAQLYTKALKIAPNNPRVVLGKAQWNMGGAKFFGQSTEPFCKEIERALELFKTEKKQEEFYPFGGIDRAKEALKQCGNVSITVTVTNVTSDKGRVSFALYTKNDFLKKPLQRKSAEIKDRKSTIIFEGVGSGEYAVTCYHDKNNNKKMDFDSTGIPLEDYGTSNNVMTFGPPQYNNAKFEVANKNITLEIRF